MLSSCHKGYVGSIRQRIFRMNRIDSIYSRAHNLSPLPSSSTTMVYLSFSFSLSLSLVSTTLQICAEEGYRGGYTSESIIFHILYWFHSTGIFSKMVESEIFQKNQLLLILSPILISKPRSFLSSHSKSRVQHYTNFKTTGKVHSARPLSLIYNPLV